MQENKKHSTVIVLLWIVFFMMVACVVYLSFQNGGSAKEFGGGVIEYIAKWKYPDRKPTLPEMLALTYEIRQTGRVCAFFCIGILGTAVIHATCKRCNWMIKTGLAAVILGLLAYLTEKLKIYIPSRHYSYEEMILSIVSVIAGVLLVSLITLAAKARKALFKKKAEVN